MKIFEDVWKHGFSKSGIAVHEGAREDRPIRERALVRHICLNALSGNKAGTICNCCLYAISDLHNAMSRLIPGFSTYFASRVRTSCWAYATYLWV